MRNLFFNILIFTVIVLCLIPIMATVTAAESKFVKNIQAEIPEKDDTQVIYKIGIELLNIGSIDKQHGTYEITFWVIITNNDDDGPDNDINFVESPPPIQWDFVNGNIDEITGVSVQPDFYKFKVRGVFHNDVDFRDYPFDDMDLVIHMEPFHPNTAEKMEFKINKQYSGIVNVFTASVPGWELAEPKFEISEYSYVWGNFTRFSATYHVETDFLGPFLKKIFPVIVLILFVFASFTLSARNISDRIAIISAALLAAIMFHATFLLSELPPIGYLTLVDKIMISAYALFLFSLFVVLLHRYLYQDGQNTYTIKDAELLDKKMAVIAIAILSTVFVVLYYLY